MRVMGELKSSMDASVGPGQADEESTDENVPNLHDKFSGSHAHVTLMTDSDLLQCHGRTS